MGAIHTFESGWLDSEHQLTNKLTLLSYTIHLEKN